MILAAWSADVDEVDGYCVHSQPGRRQIVSSSMRMSVAIKQLQEPIMDWKWSYTRTRRLEEETADREIQCEIEWRACRLFGTSKLHGL